LYGLSYISSPIFMALSSLCIPTTSLSSGWWPSTSFVITLTLGLWPKQGLARVQDKREARKNILYFWECKRVWENEFSHSQGNSHLGS
jgi:hypothetical protein